MERMSAEELNNFNVELRNTNRSQRNNESNINSEQHTLDRRQNNDLELFNDDLFKEIENATA